MAYIVYMHKNLVSVPYLIDKGRDSAYEAIKANRLNYEDADTESSWTVKSQIPEAGELLKAGSVIRLEWDVQSGNPQNLIEKSVTLEKNGKYIEAIKSLEGIGEDSDFYIDAQERISEIESTYTTYVIEQANNLLHSNAYDEAYEILEKASRNYGDQSTFNNKKNDIENKVWNNVKPIVTVSSSKANFIEGDVLKTNDIEIQLYYTERFQKKVFPTSITPKLLEKYGENDIILTYEGGHECEWTVYAQPRMVSIQAEYEGKQLTKGDTISNNNVLVYGIYSDGTKEELDDYNMEPRVVENTGENTILISFGDMHTNLILNALPRYTLLKDVKLVKGRSEKLFRSNGEDTLGNTYLNYLLISYNEYDFEGHGNVIFNIKGEYQHFCTTIAPGTFGDDSMHALKPVIVEIVGDENVLYASPGIELTTQPFSIDIDVTGIRILEIRCKESGAIFMDEPKLY